MSDLVGPVVGAVATAVLLALLGVVVSRWRHRRAVAAARRDVGRAAAPDAGEWFLWRVHGPLLGLRPARLRLAPGTVSWTDRGRVQPRWQVPASQVRLEVRRPGGSEDAARFVLHGPDGRHPVRVTATSARPLGTLDRRYLRQTVWDAEAFVDAASDVGVQVEDRGGRDRP